MNPSLAPYLYQEELYNISDTTLIVLPRVWHTYTDEEKALLSKILASVKLNLSSVQIISSPDFSIELSPSQAVGKILVFGSAATGIKPYEHVRAQGFSVLVADDLSRLDDAKKKSLWLALKDMFAP